MKLNVKIYEDLLENVIRFKWDIVYFEIPSFFPSSHNSQTNIVHWTQPTRLVTKRKCRGASVLRIWWKMRECWSEVKYFREQKIICRVRVELRTYNFFFAIEKSQIIPEQPFCIQRENEGNKISCSNEQPPNSFLPRQPPILQGSVAQENRLQASSTRTRTATSGRSKSGRRLDASS